MKKIIPIVTVLGAGALLAGCSTNMQVKKENFTNYLRSFQENVEDYTKLEENKNLSKVTFNKYKLNIQTQEDDLIENLDAINSINETESIADMELQEQELNVENTTEIRDNELKIENNQDDQTDDELEDKIQQISTLYSLSNDIENSCDDFCELKEEITNAIIETQNLINQIQEKKIELSREQRMFITEQSLQLKNLGRQLSNITTELSFNLSDLNTIMTENNQDIDNLSLKYLVVLDNLVNGNEMLQSGISTLNLINQMFNLPNGMPSNNRGRILYGFQNNNEPAVFKDYIYENGELKENTQDNTENNEENAELATENEKKTNIDTYANTNLKSNIDTYGNYNTPRNIDTFFNTALLDNEFMYGNGNYGGYGMNNGMYGYNPYMQNYYQYEQGNTTNRQIDKDNTQNIDNQNSNNTNKRNKKKFTLKKNIDTYMDENEPHISIKIQNIKNSISGFFNKFKKSDLNDKIKNPVYRESSQD